MEADGAFVIVTFTLVSNPGQGGEGAIEYFTAYVPGVLAVGVMAPVVGSITRPAPALKVPPFVPLIITAT